MWWKKDDLDAWNLGFVITSIDLRYKGTSSDMMELVGGFVESSTQRCRREKRLETTGRDATEHATQSNKEKKDSV